MRNFLRMAMVIACAAAGTSALAADTTWQGPGAVFNDNGNWSAGAPPGGGDTGIFANNAAPTALTINSGGGFGPLRFEAGAPAYSFTWSGNALSLVGGITNNSSNAPTFNINNLATFIINGGSAANAIVELNNGGSANFINGANASTAAITIHNGGGSNFTGTSTAGQSQITVENGGVIGFADSSNAGTAAINITGGQVYFGHTASASSATITIDGGALNFLHNATAGNATINSLNGSSPVTFQNSSTAGSATINMTNGAVLSFQQTSSGGTAALSADTNSIIDFSATAGPNNDKKVGFGSLSGDGALFLGANEVSIGGNNASTTFSGLIADCNPDCGAVGEGLPTAPGTLIKVGSGTLTLTGANTYTGATMIDAGELAAGHNLAFAGTAVTINDGGTLGFAGGGGFILSNFVTLNGDAMVSVNGTDTNELAGPIDGTGALNKQGTGTLLLSSPTNSYSGGNIVSAGILKSGAENAFGLGPIMVAAGATADLDGNNQTIEGLSGSGMVVLGSGRLTISGNGSSAFSGNISGTGGLTKQGTGTQTLTGNQTYTGSTIIGSGTLQLGDGTASGALASGSITNNGTLAFNPNGAQTFSTPIDGTGGVTKNGTGALTLTGNHGYTGVTVIASGTLQLGNGVASATLATSAIDNSGNLTFDLPGNVNVTTPITGTGSVTKLGANTLTFATAQTYTGPTFVNAGTVVVNGSLASIVTLASGATLRGTGTVAGIIADNGSFTAPGNSIGTLHVAGNVSFAAGSTYIVETNVAGQSDLIDATGTAAILGGTVQVDTSAGYDTMTTYTILTANGGVNGTFAGLSIDNPALQAFLTYDARNVFLRVAPKTLPPGTTPNQNTTRDGIGSGGTIFDTLLTGTTANAQTAYDILSGEIHATLLTSLLMDSLNTRRMMMAQGDRPNDDPGIYYWAYADQHWGYISGDGNAAGAHREYFQIMTGADTRIARGWRVGLEAGYGQEYLQVVARASTARFNRGTVGAYFHGRAGSLRLHGGVAQMWGTVKTTRSIRYAGFSDFTTSKQDVDGTQAFVEAGYPTILGSFTLEPIAGLSWVRGGAGGARETGGAAALDVAAGSLEGIFSLLGAQTLRSYRRGDELLYTLFLRAGWQHDFGHETVMRNLSLVSTGRGYSILGLQTDADRALIDANATIYLDDIHLSFGYLGAHSANENDHALRAYFGWKF